MLSSKSLNSSAASGLTMLTVVTLFQSFLLSAPKGSSRTSSSLSLSISLPSLGNYHLLPVSTAYPILDILYPGSCAICGVACNWLLLLIEYIS